MRAELDVLLEKRASALAERDQAETAAAAARNRSSELADLQTRVHLGELTAEEAERRKDENVLRLGVCIDGRQGEHPQRSLRAADVAATGGVRQRSLLQLLQLLPADGRAARVREKLRAAGATGGRNST
jgi:hypothetical protein